MAASSGFKQPCPSCEALVPVKDASLIGKKIDCPKCKYRFVVEDPVAKDKQAIKADQGDKAKKPAPANKPAAAPPAAKKTPPAPAKAPPKKGAAPAEDVDELDEVDEGEEEDKTKEAITSKPRPGSKPAAAAKSKPPAKRARDEEADEDTGGKKPKKKQQSENKKKLLVGLGLGAVGLVVLGVAAVLMRSSPTNPVGSTPGGTIPAPGPVAMQPGEEPPTTNKEGPPKDTKKPAPVAFNTVQLAAAGPELTNLLPNTTEHVFHLRFKDLLETPVVADAAQAPGIYNDEELRKRLGFSPKAIDAVLRAESYTFKWAFNVIHTTEPLSEESLTEALGLKPAPGSPVKNQIFFEVPTRNPWLEQFARLSLTARSVRETRSPKEIYRPLLVRLHNQQTLIVADAAPMMEFLKEGGQFKYMTDQTGSPTTSGTGTPTGTEGSATPGTPAAPAAAAPMPGAITSGVRFGTYMTIKPDLKAMLDRVETTVNPSTRVLFSSATDMAAARVTSSNPEDKNRILSRPRQLWDVTLSLTEKTPRIRVLGSSLHKKDTLLYFFQNSLDCSNDLEAKNLKTDLLQQVAPTFTQFFEAVLGQKLEVVLDTPATTPGSTTGSTPTGSGSTSPSGSGSSTTDPKSVVEEIKNSRVRALQTEKNVTFAVDLVLNGEDLSKLQSMAALTLGSFRAELDAAAGLVYRHDLAKAGRLLGEQGVSDKEVPPRTYPPAAFKRAGSSKRTAREPNQRVSWMAGLLPHLGQETLYSNIKFEASWKDPVNWLAAHTLVPQFLDPTYPESTRKIAHPGVPLEVGATHFVGIAGIGIDAADYAADDPAAVGKLGVFGYDRSTALDKIKKGRGLANTILLVQVPPEGPAGVTPWMAGGGSTVRGVPEKGSVRPFVHNHGGKRGTYVLMTDGSVRFVSETVSDDVFKALCTVEGPAPENLKLDKVAPLVPAPAAPKVETAEEPKKEFAAPKLKEKPAAAAETADPAAWQEFVSKEGGYAVLMPGPAQTKQVPLPPQAGGGTMTITMVEQKNKAFGVLYLDVSAQDLKAMPLEQRFAGAREGGLSRMPGGKLKSERNITLGDNPGKEFEIEAPSKGGNLVTRVYLVGQRFYTIIAGGEGLTSDAEEVQRFLNSFRLLSK